MSEMTEEAWEVLNEIGDAEGLCDDALDDLVIDVASRVGSNVNDRGIRSQIPYLLKQGISRETVITTLKEGRI